jgi:hypothetical protein
MLNRFVSLVSVLLCNYFIISSYLFRTFDVTWLIFIPGSRYSVIIVRQVWFSRFFFTTQFWISERAERRGRWTPLIRMGLWKSFLPFRVDLSRPHFRSEKVTVHSALRRSLSRPWTVQPRRLPPLSCLPLPLALGAEPSLSVNPRRLEP